MAKPSVASENTKATYLASAWRSRGRNATMIAPTSGTAPMTVSQGKSLMCSQPHQQKGTDHEGRAAKHRQCVVAHEARLQAAYAARRATDQRSQAVDESVDAAVVEEDQRTREILTRPHEDRLVERVAVEVL